MREHGIADNTVLVLTSDHGEAFREHGYKYHGRGVFDELLRVPLLIRFPGPDRPTGRVGALTQTVDLLPTIFELFRVPYPQDSVQGTSLLPLIAGEAERVRDFVFATCSGSRPSYLVRDEEFALILYEGGRHRALYDLKADPRQKRNVLDDYPEKTADLIEAFRRFAAAQTRPPFEFIDPEWEPQELPQAPEVELSDEQRQELEALGYLD